MSGIPEAVRVHLGMELKALYASILDEDQPPTLLGLIAQLDVGSTPATPAVPDAFRAGLLDALPGLRAFAVSLTINPTAADDLVQETLLKAWANRHRFESGSNLMAWLCTILRNQFYTVCRKRKREVEDADGVLAGKILAPAAQEASSDLRRVWEHLGKLPAAQREALMLVAAQGMTYEAAAELIGCQVGTMKSRVSRARSFLAGSLGMEPRHAAAT
ncbi:sigma-70 family RNA polymerase sigma factor [Methylobacterium adhaesivum]|uniref:RNA polymerase sigma factor n=2 Tax=Methylobacterium adhaesivum TaxID=333297 RepID=A0ABT8BND8_9HYPH|nr:sigma-70 family RNA polymerase sigma factor [Methylobacterium adhaesivum]MDN3593060.1 sigma-70 family RNA polymerase sigma factor [Methylobacterium adhaesivum]